MAFRGRKELPRLRAGRCRSKRATATVRDRPSIRQRGQHLAAGSNSTALQKPMDGRGPLELRFRSSAATPNYCVWQQYVGPWPTKSTASPFTRNIALFMPANPVDGTANAPVGHTPPWPPVPDFEKAMFRCGGDEQALPHRTTLRGNSLGRALCGRGFLLPPLNSYDCAEGGCPRSVPARRS